MRTNQKSIALLIMMVIPTWEASPNLKMKLDGGLDDFTLDPPFNVFKYLPESSNDVGTKFFLNMPNNYGGIGVQISMDATEAIKEGMNLNLPLHVLIHGFQGSESDEWLFSMKNALLRKHECNVIIVGWKNGARLRLDFWNSYDRAKANTRLVARQIRVLLGNFGRHRPGIFNFAKVHIIGHSLGAQISGMVGTEVEDVFRQRIGRISGLDPAGPGFRGTSLAVRLDKTDASFVDVIHTDGDCYGYNDTAGNVDFYPNGGDKQEGCSFSDFCLASARGGKGWPSCSHARSHKFYLESLTRSNTCKFTGYPCPGGWEQFNRGACRSCGTAAGGCSEMGYNSIGHRARGIMYLKTNGNSPFCKVDY